VINTAKYVKISIIAAQGATEIVAPVRRRECSLNIRENSASPLAVQKIKTKKR
jgi:hypothetical protein